MIIYIMEDEYDHFAYDEPGYGREPVEVSPQMWDHYLDVKEKWEAIQKGLGKLYRNAVQDRKYGTELGRYNK